MVEHTRKLHLGEGLLKSLLISTLIVGRRERPFLIRKQDGEALIDRRISND